MRKYSGEGLGTRDEEKRLCPTPIPLAGSAHSHDFNVGCNSAAYCTAASWGTGKTVRVRLHALGVPFNWPVGDAPC